MAVRPVFVPDDNQSPFVKEVMIEFKWYSGFSISQAKRSVRSLHAEAAKKGISPVLEISSKSSQPFGVELSAFNLMLDVKGHPIMSVECAFQGSKVFECGGPFTDLYTVTSREAKKDERLNNSGDIIHFNFLGERFLTQPLTAFYDWLYLKALINKEKLTNELLEYMGFTDIAFNPQKSFNCQARSAALFVALTKAGLIDKVLQNKHEYLATIKGELKYPTKTDKRISQQKLPFGKKNS